jgi:hypothetical protein
MRKLAPFNDPIVQDCVISFDARCRQQSTTTASEQSQKISKMISLVRLDFYRSIAAFSSFFPDGFSAGARTSQEGRLAPASN